MRFWHHLHKESDFGARLQCKFLVCGEPGLGTTVSDTREGWQAKRWQRCDCSPWGLRSAGATASAHSAASTKVHNTKTQLHHMHSTQQAPQETLTLTLSLSFTTLDFYAYTFPLTLSHLCTCIALAVAITLTLTRTFTCAGPGACAYTVALHGH